MFGSQISYCYNFCNPVIMRPNILNSICQNVTVVRHFAARKGYREAAKKKKVKVVIEKQGWIPHNLRKKEDKVLNTLRSSEHKMSKAIDDVCFIKSRALRMFDLTDAVDCLRETHHPTMYNVPDAQINVYLELDMRTARPTRFADKFSRMAILPHVFEQDGLLERSIMVFCKTPEQKEEAQNAGASLVGGVELIKEIEKGKIVLPDYRFVIAHPTILPEMVTIRGLLKRRFPTVKSGTLGPNLGELVVQFKNGVEYSCVKDEKMVEFGMIDSTIGRLDMKNDQLKENFQALLDDINLMKPKRPGPFVTRVLMSTRQSTQGPLFIDRLKINLAPFLPEEEEGGESSDEDEVEAVKQ